MKQLKQNIIAEAAQMACLLEASCEKPGSVTPSKQFDDLGYTDFLLSSVILGQTLRQTAHKSVGEIILTSVKGCKKEIPSNANLGIILLIAPLANAFYKRGELDSKNVQPTLRTLTIADADKTFAAIELADPGGLGKAPAHDVHKKATVTLLRAMKLAADRDWIAYEYAHNFDITFTFGVPELIKNIQSTGDFRDAVIQTYLKLLYLYPDSHIARRASNDTALKISEKAGIVLQKGGVTSVAGRRAITVLDKHLRSRSNLFNPGTTSDLIAATLFVYFLKYGYNSMNQRKKK